MPQIEMGKDEKYLTVSAEGFQVIIDREKGDVRITDFSHVIKVRFNQPKPDVIVKLEDILVDDVFVHEFLEG